MKPKKKEYSLPKNFATKWLAALRSGEYQQAQSELYNIDSKGYCCLGVALAISGYNLTKNRDAATCGWPADAYRNPRIPKTLWSDDGDSLAWYVADMNDNGKTFEQIADWIEENVELI